MRTRSKKTKNSNHSYYRRIHTQMWGDARFKDWSSPNPNAQWLWVYLLTGPHTESIPGLYHLSVGEIADSLGWGYEDTQKCLQEIIDSGRLIYDKKFNVIWIKKAVHYSAPNNFDVVRGWISRVSQLPESPLVKDALLYFAEYLKSEKGEKYQQLILDSPRVTPCRTPCRTSCMPPCRTQKEKEKEKEKEKKKKKDLSLFSEKKEKKKKKEKWDPNASSLPPEKNENTHTETGLQKFIFQEKQKQELVYGKSPDFPVTTVEDFELLARHKWGWSFKHSQFSQEKRDLAVKLLRQSPLTQAEAKSIREECINSNSPWINLAILKLSDMRNSESKPTKLNTKQDPREIAREGARKFYESGEHWESYKQGHQELIGEEASELEQVYLLDSKDEKYVQ